LRRINVSGNLTPLLKGAFADVRIIAAIDVIWPTFLGGCSITRDTEKWLREAGNWRSVDLKQPELEPSYEVIPHIEGTLTK
jgi:hypothetical protein